ncbi:hypothetical protein Syun_009761 [Stephania yunnanensis]|uniref:Uncharacterized protein n=1 Tax=Stephania yunnanensis TaxID=152371 RepID=A0AAP0KF91_9MAGN
MSRQSCLAASVRSSELKIQERTIELHLIHVASIFEPDDGHGIDPFTKPNLYLAWSALVIARRHVV